MPPPGQPLCDAQLAAEVGTFIMGGFETTAHSLAFALLRVAACGRAQVGWGKGGMGPSGWRA